MSGRPDYLSKVALDNSQSASREAGRATNQVERLTNDVERLLMITEALWLILKKEHNYSDEVLTKLVHEIDMRDGVLNGRGAAQTEPAAQPCPACGKPNAGNRPLCLYCGKPVPVQPFAR
jgi:hypothetical protein